MTLFSGGIRGCANRNGVGMLVSMSAAEKGLPERLRDARKAKGLSMDAAAAKLGVSKTSISRWEAGELTPRDHWAEIERVYGRSRLDLEFGVAEEHAGDPPYPGWTEFLDWLEESPFRSSAEPWMLTSMRRLRVPADLVMTADGYRTILLAYIAALKSAKH